MKTTLELYHLRVERKRLKLFFSPLLCYIFFVTADPTI